MDFQFPVKPPAFQVMLKPHGPVCNLDCTYCYYLEKENLYPGNRKFILQDELLEIYTRDYIQSQDVPVVSFVWQGGEPTMLGIEYFRKAVALQKKYAGDKRIENSFQTNATLLTDEFCAFFREHDFLIGVSIDGPKALHDFYRKNKAGEPSWDKVMRGIGLLKKHGVEFNTLSVVNRKTGDHPLDVYNFLKQIGSTFMQFIPIVERATDMPGPDNQKLVHHTFRGDARLTDWSVGARQYGSFLCSIFDEWVRNDVGKYYVQIFDVTLANWVGANPGLCVFTEKCGTAAVMEHNGDIYCCDHFVYPDYLLGNIRDQALSSIMSKPKLSMFGQDKKAGLPPYCLQCEVRFACHGECPKHRFEKTPQGDPGLNYLCEGYKMFFEHVKPSMDFMAKELKHKRAPANVMQWIRHKDATAISQQRISAGRNEPCPCGSGKKYKHCHMRT